LVAGAAIGFVGGLLGIGGGLLAIPLLGLIFGMSQQAAQGTALIMVLPAILLAVRKYNQHERINFQAALFAAVSSILCTWVGARIALGIDSIILRRNYAVFVLGIAVYYLVQVWRHRGRAGQKKPVKAPLEGCHPLWFIPIGCLGGMVGGIFGIGGSVVAVPLLTAVYGLSQSRAQAFGLAMIIPGIFVALLTYAQHGQADWLMGLPMAIGSIALVPHGVRLAYRLPEARLKLTFACMLLVIMVLLLLNPQ